MEDLKEGRKPIKKKTKNGIIKEKKGMIYFRSMSVPVYINFLIREVFGVSLVKQKRKREKEKQKTELTFREKSSENFSIVLFTSFPFFARQKSSNVRHRDAAMVY